MEDRGTYSPKEKYRRMFDDAIGQRMGSMALWRVLDEIGFFTSPASTKYHLSVPGGLLFIWRGVSFWYRDTVSGAEPRLRLLNAFHESQARP